MEIVLILLKSVCAAIAAIFRQYMPPTHIKQEGCFKYLSFLQPSADTSNFIIEDLTAGSRYVAHVCVTGTLPRDVPRGSNFSSQCGYCRTCFGVQPSNGKYCNMMYFE